MLHQYDRQTDISTTLKGNLQTLVLVTFNSNDKWQITADNLIEEDIIRKEKPTRVSDIYEILQESYIKICLQNYFSYF